MTPPRKNTSEELDAKIKTTNDLATRIDERVRSLIENQDKVEAKLERFLEKQIEVMSKVLINEQNIEDLHDTIDDIDTRLCQIEEGHVLLNSFRKGTESTFKNMGNYFINFVMAILIGYILYILKFER